MNRPRVFADFHNADPKGRLRFELCRYSRGSHMSENLLARRTITYPLQ